LWLLAHAGSLRAPAGGALGVVPGHQHMDLAAGLRSRGDGVERGALQAAVIVFGNDECGHGQITLASLLSVHTSVAPAGALMPALRLGGSSTFSVLMRGATSTPRS